MTQDGRPSENDNVLLKELKTAKKFLKSSKKCEHARRNAQHRDDIINARTRDTKQFHKLIKRNRKKLGCFIDDLNVDGVKYSGMEAVANGFREHFSNLAKKI